MLVENAIIGVPLSPTAAFSTNENTGGVRVINYAGIRTDTLPVRMSGNVVAGSNDMGFMHSGEDCNTMQVFNNEAFAVVVGVFVTPLGTDSGSTCQGVSLYKVWKA